jgi:outer membrane protein assembly factor BamC
MKIAPTLVMVTAASILTGCGMLPSMPFIGGDDKPKKTTYIDLRPQAPLEVPADLRQVKPSQVSAIPAIGEQRNASYYPNRPPLPDAKYASDNRDEVRVQRLGSRSWLVIPESPTTAWPKMKQFFADNGIVLIDDRPDVGRLNTAWLEDTSSPARDIVRTLMQRARSEAGLESGEDRFLLRVEQGMQPQSTEVHLRHDNDELNGVVAPDLLRVQEVNSDLVAAEKALLEQIGGYVAARVAESTVSKVALQIGSQPKSDMRRNADGIPELSFFLDRKRALASLTQSLRNAGVLINSEDSDAGRFDISIPNEVLTGKKSGGILCRVTFSCGSQNETNVTLLMSEAIATDKGDAYKIFVLQDGQLMADADKAQEILVMIREFAT